MKVHYSPIAGKWYPSDSGELLELAVRLFHESEDRAGPPLNHPLAFVVPHAGLAYSGRVAAAAYRHIAHRRPRRVILLGFSHTRLLRGIAIPDISIYATPLGEIAVDREAATLLQHYPPFQATPESILCDHSVEIQLPLLAYAHHDVHLLPLYVGELDSAAREEAAKALSQLLDGDTFLLASSDFTHYGRAFQYQPFPVNAETPSLLHRLDAEIIDAASSLSSALFRSTTARLRSTTCGAAPIQLLLDTLRLLESSSRETIFQKRLDYETSGDRTGDFHHSVSYACLGYFPQKAFSVSAETASLLKAMVWETILHQEHRPLSLLPESASRHDPLMLRQGVFVTIYRQGKLQGCTGCIDPHEPLLKTVPATTQSTLRDPRFDPLPAGEHIDEIEISLLTPLRRLTDLAQFELGVDGLELEAWNKRALLLPQVALNRSWSRELFLSALAQKAGLPNEIYNQPDTRLYRFRVQRIHSIREEFLPA